MRKCLLFCFYCFFFSTCFSQDLTGIWRGHFRSSNARLEELLGEDDRYKFEVQVDQHRKAFDGVTYSYKSTVFYGKALCRGTFNTTTKKVLLEELKIVDVKMMSGSDACIMTCFLQYSKMGDDEFLEGSYTSMNTRDSSACGKGTILLRKVNTSDFYKEPFLVKKEKQKEDKTLLRTDSSAVAKAAPATSPPAKKPSPIAKAPATRRPANNATASTTKKQTTPPAGTSAKKPVTHVPVAPPASNRVTISPDTMRKLAPVTAPAPPPVSIPKVLATRDNELVKTITTSSKEIQIRIYDNGVIDHDTVSVYLDKKLVVSHQMLTEKAIVVKFQLDETKDYHELVMVAENLGDIPPNTSLMVVDAGSKQYEVRITSTEQKNAVVIFKYEKEK